MNCVVTVSNPGNQTATNVSVVQSLPPGLSLDSSNLPMSAESNHMEFWRSGTTDAKAINYLHHQ